MSRIHLFEFEDQRWFPQWLRNYMTDFLQFLSNKTGLYKPIIPKIGQTLIKSKTAQIIDLGSGGGGGLIWLNQELQKEIPELKILLTDYYPNITAFKHTQQQSKNFHFLTEAVDARKVPQNLSGLRTMFLSFHHFKPNDARQILQNAVNSNSSIAVFEVQERSFPSIVAMLLSPLSVWLTTPFIRPFKFGRLFFTYLIPIIPLFVLWDGIVSSLRTYSVDEMNELINGLDNKDTLQWEVGKIASGPGKILFLIGTKRYQD